MRQIQKINLRDYKVIVFDWDGTLVDSHEAYRLWDKLYMQTFYGVEKPVEYFEELSKILKEVSIGDAENKYFRYLDVTFGDGKTPMREIWDNVYKLAPKVQSKVEYKTNATEILYLLRRMTDSKIAISTNSSMKDLEFYSSSRSKTAQTLKPIEFFDYMITSDMINHTKPHPESYQKITEYFSVNPSDVLVFEDSLRGIQSAKSAGATVVSIYSKFEDKHKTEILSQSDFHILDWGDMLGVVKMI